MWALAGLWASVPAAAPAALPAAAARLDTSRITAGQPVELSFLLRHRPDESPAVPDPGEVLPGFSVRPLGTPTRRPAGAAVETLLRYELRLYEVGAHPIPAFPVHFIGATGDTLLRTTGELEIEVLSVREEGDEALRDITAPLRVPGGIPLWLAGMLAALAVAVLVAAILWLLDRRKGETEAPPPVPVDYAAEFVRIAGLGLVDRGELKTYYSLLSENLRRFLDERLGLQAMELTTAELERALYRAELERPIVGDVSDFLRGADLVKFARFVPATEEARRVPEAGMAVIRSIDAVQARPAQEELDRAPGQAAG